MGVANALQMIAETVGQCRQVLEDLVRRRGGKEMTLDTFRYAITTIKGVATYDGIYTRPVLVPVQTSRDGILHRRTPGIDYH